jgi:VIT1/CCC1 family predicted Fe2+/Mn2+ transporter
LDPADRASEILFGLIMVLTFTLSLGVTEAGRADVRAVLLGALGCNLAWGIIDAVLYVMGARAERALGASSIRAVRAADDDAAHAIIASHLPPAVVPALTRADLERIRLHLITLPEEALQVRLGKADYLGAVGVFLLVTLCLVPVAFPFFFIDDVAVALRISNAVALVLLFLTGFTFGRYVGQPWRVGLSMVAVGIVMVGIAMALGG